MMHRITTLDIMDDNLDDLFKGEKADCLYSDPPWGETNLKYWRTINNQKGHLVNWHLFLERLNYLYNRHVSGPLFLETGLRFEKDVIEHFGKPSMKFICQYKSGIKLLPNILLCWGAVPEININGLSGFNVVYSCLSSYGKMPTIVFDPCVGLGLTAKACIKIGATCFANELNADRAKRTMKIFDSMDIPC